MSNPQSYYRSSGKNRQRERKNKREQHLHLVPSVRPPVDEQSVDNDSAEVVVESSRHMGRGMKTIVRVFLVGIGVSILFSVLAYMFL